MRPAPSPELSFCYGVLQHLLIGLTASFVIARVKQRNATIDCLYKGLLNQGVDAGLSGVLGRPKRLDYDPKWALLLVRDEQAPLANLLEPGAKRRTRYPATKLCQDKCGEGNED